MSLLMLWTTMKIRGLISARHLVCPPPHHLDVNSQAPSLPLIATTTRGACIVPKQMLSGLLCDFHAWDGISKPKTGQHHLIQLPVNVDSGSWSEDMMAQFSLDTTRQLSYCSVAEIGSLQVSH